MSRVVYLGLLSLAYILQSYLVISTGKCHVNPTSPSNGQMVGPCCDNLDTVSFTCNQGYKLAGAEVLQCSEGRWNGSAPECTPGPVCRIPQKPNGIVESRRSGQTFIPNDVISYKCDTDYYFEKKVERENDYNYGSYDDEVSEFADEGAEFIIYYDIAREIKCLGNGQWSMSFPDCHAFKCEPPAPIRNGFIDFQGPQSSKYDGGRVISYSCGQKYILVGPSRRKCSMKAGGWTGNDPQCIQIRCPTPEVPNHSYIDNPRLNKVGDTIHIHCIRGYTLQGSSSMTCGAYADWSGTTPTCHKADIGVGRCQAPVIPFGGRIINSNSGNSYELNDTVKYTCYGSNRLIGPEEVRCTSEGWMPNRQPKCEVPFSFDNPTELAQKFTRLFDKLENKTSEIENNIVVNRGRYLNINSETGLDIYFLIDSSASVIAEDFRKAVNFVKVLVKKVGVSSRSNGARVGVTTFSDDVVKQFGLNNGFHTRQNNTLEEVLGLLDKLNYSQGSTNIRGALEFVQNQMLPMSLRSREDAKQYLFLLSDGDDNMGGNPIPVAQELKKPTTDDPRMEIFCIKVGLEKDADKKMKNEEKLRAISSELEMNGNGTEPHFFRLKDFVAFDILVQTIVQSKLDYSECGMAGVKTAISSANIINGEVAFEHAWPWMASILVKKKNEAGLGAFKHTCGGTLINSEWILTAAHCFPGERHEQNLDQIRVKLGSNQWKLESNTDAIKVKSMQIHWGWRVDGKMTWENDIALLRLAVSARLSNKTRTICLANNSDEHNALFYSGAVNGVVTGWGFYKNRTVGTVEEPKLTSDNLRQVELRVVQKNSERYCEPPAEEKIVCAGSSGMADSCVGDSGGPLMVHTAKDAKGERRWYQIGIVSYGKGCGFGNEREYARYTDLRHYRDWIKYTIKYVTESANPSR